MVTSALVGIFGVCSVAGRVGRERFLKGLLWSCGLFLIEAIARNTAKNLCISQKGSNALKDRNKQLTGKRKSWLHTNELLTVRQDISQGRQQSANPKQSPKCNRRSSKYSLVFFFCSSSPYSVASQPNAHMECTAKATEQQYIGEWNAL